MNAQPDGYRELRCHKILTEEPATLTPPALAHGRIYCRSYRGELVCLDIAR